MAKIAIFYLDRWGNPPRFAEAFLKSLATYPAGVAYDLIWQMKGYPKGMESQALRGFKDIHLGSIKKIHYSDDLYQFNLAIDAASHLNYEFLLFFISWSRVLAPSWLKFYLDGFERNLDCGVVGATASFERHSNDQTFPNAHVRTNAFMIRRDLFLSLEFGDLRTKAAGNLFEAGPNNLTRQLEQRGLAPLLIDRFGNEFRKEDWVKSRTFRSGLQDNLLVADNRTNDFATASNKRRRKLARLAWGEDALLQDIGLMERLRARVRWRWPVFTRPADTVCKEYELQ